MTNKPAKKEQQTDPILFWESANSEHDSFEFRSVSEMHGVVMTVIFLASAFYIVYAFNQTVITVLQASKLLCAFGLGAFLLAYTLRNRFSLSLIDGLFYSAFGVAPLLLSLFFMVNSTCDHYFTEKYRIVAKERGGSGFTVELENEAYDDYWHIRNLNQDEVTNRYGKIEYTFCEGVFGYRVMKNRELVW